VVQHAGADDQVEALLPFADLFDRELSKLEVRQLVSASACRWT
jgi:hypothetical protein